VLLRLAAGSGIAGLAGIPAHTWVEGVSVVRPFLAVAKARLVATCRAEGWRFVEDPSNSDPRFARGRLRRAGPILAAEGLTAQRLARLAERARRADEVVQAAAAEALARSTLTAAPGELRLDGRSLLQGPEAVAIAALSRAVAAVTRPEAPRLKLERLESACLDRLRPAFASGLGCRLTLAGLLLDLAPDGSLRLTPAPGRRPRKGLSEGSDAAGAPHSLGNAGGGA
jgi:tRNA(Ile)-lysidine synthase